MAGYDSTISGAQVVEGINKVLNDVYSKTEVDRMVSGGGGVMPLGYSQLEYIEGTGTQYIDTNLQPSSSKYRVVIKFMYTRNHDGLSLFGNTYSKPHGLTVHGSKPLFYVGNSSDISCGPQTELNTEYTLDVTADNGKLTAIWNGVEYTTSYTGSMNTSYDVNVFGSSKYGAIAELGDGYRLYSLQIYNNDLLVRDFVPCEKAGAIGLFDLLGNVFYVNAGSGVFLGGPVVSNNAIPIGKGGTGAVTAEGARANLDVYSKQEVDEAIANAITATLNTEV